jgi:hypothetical protein
MRLMRWQRPETTPGPNYRYEQDRRADGKRGLEPLSAQSRAGETAEDRRYRVNVSAPNSRVPASRGLVGSLSTFSGLTKPRM